MCKGLAGIIICAVGGNELNLRAEALRGERDIRAFTAGQGGKLTPCYRFAGFG